MEHLNFDGSFIVWDKKADPDLHHMSSCDIAWYSRRKQIKTFRGAWCGAVKFTPRMTTHIHEKPAALYEWLLTNYAKPGQKILDTHLGSGSSAIAAHYYGVDFVGCEIDTDYYKATIKRFKMGTQQMTIDL
jgi:site-specific DNA-methyltransferase (adenine-specific)